MTPRTLALVGAISLLALGVAGCGKLGALERPGPDTGVDAGPEPSRTVRTVDPRNHNSDPSPPRTDPIDSTNNPAAVSPQGALEDPYARPQ